VDPTTEPATSTQAVSAFRCGMKPDPPPVPTGKFVCVTRPDGEQTVVSIIGDIDFATAQEVRDVLHNSFAVFSRPVVVDLRRVDFIDSAGAHVILNAQADAAQQGFTMELSAPPRIVRHAFETLGIVGRSPMTDV
jgi:anti-sigma B factor antagonist